MDDPQHALHWSAVSAGIYYAIKGWRTIMYKLFELTENTREKWNSFSPGKREILLRLIILMPFCVMLVVTGLNFRLIGDEGFYHLKVVEKFSSEWPFPDIRDYPSASTPLPYLMLTAVGKIIGFEIWKLRLVTVLLTLLATNLFYDLCRRHKFPSPLLSALSLLFFPYVFFHGFTIYTVCFALFFEVLAMKYYLAESSTPKDLIKGGIAATLAIYCRQEYLALPAGMLLYELVSIPREKPFSTIKTRFLNWAILAMPVISIIPLLILWGGANPPAHQFEYYLTIVPHHLNFAPIFAGFYFLPLLLDIRWMLNFKYAVLIVILALSPVFIFFPLTFEEWFTQTASAAGIIPHGMDLIRQNLGDTIGVLVKILLWAIGIIFIVAKFAHKEWDPMEKKLFSILSAFLGLAILTPYLADRYYMFAVAPLVLILHRPQRDWKIYLAGLAYLVVLSLFFSYWQIYLKSFDSW